MCGSKLSLSKAYRQNCFDGKLDSQICILKCLIIDKRKEIKLLSKSSEKTKVKNQAVFTHIIKVSDKEENLSEAILGSLRCF